MCNIYYNFILPLDFNLYFLKKKNSKEVSKKCLKMNKQIDKKIKK